MRAFSHSQEPVPMMHAAVQKLVEAAVVLQNSRPSGRTSRH